jgi:hypothetical protein
VRRRPTHLSTRRLGVRAKVAERRADRVWERGGVSDGVEYVPPFARAWDGVADVVWLGQLRCRRTCRVRVCVDVEGGQVDVVLQSLRWRLGRRLDSCLEGSVSPCVSCWSGYLTCCVGQTSGVAIASAVFQSRLDTELRLRIHVPDAEQVRGVCFSSLACSAHELPSPERNTNAKRSSPPSGTLSASSRPSPTRSSARRRMRTRRV